MTQDILASVTSLNRHILTELCTALPPPPRPYPNAHAQQRTARTCTYIHAEIRSVMEVTTSTADALGELQVRLEVLGCPYGGGPDWLPTRLSAGGLARLELIGWVLHRFAPSHCADPLIDADAGTDLGILLATCATVGLCGSSDAGLLTGAAAAAASAREGREGALGSATLLFFDELVGLAEASASARDDGAALVFTHQQASDADSGGTPSSYAPSGGEGCRNKGRVDGIDSEYVRACELQSAVVRENLDDVLTTKCRLFDTGLLAAATDNLQTFRHTKAAKNNNQQSHHQFSTSALVSSSSPPSPPPPPHRAAASVAATTAAVPTNSDIAALLAQLETDGSQLVESLSLAEEARDAALEAAVRVPVGAGASKHLLRQLEVSLGTTVQAVGAFTRVYAAELASAVAECETVNAATFKDYTGSSGSGNAASGNSTPQAAAATTAATMTHHDGGAGVRAQALVDRARQIDTLLADVRRIRAATTSLDTNGLGARLRDNAQKQSSFGPEACNVLADRVQIMQGVLARRTTTAAPVL